MNKLSIPEGREFYTPGEVAEILDKPRREIMKLIRRRDIPCHRMGPRTFRIRIPEFERWAAKKGYV